jgi:hypothetical protein
MVPDSTVYVHMQPVLTANVTSDLFYAVATALNVSSTIFGCSLRLPWFCGILNCMDDCLYGVV